MKLTQRKQRKMTEKEKIAYEKLLEIHGLIFFAFNTMLSAKNSTQEELEAISKIRHAIFKVNELTSLLGSD